jgi:hypothetical protein
MFEKSSIQPLLLFRGEKNERLRPQKEKQTMRKKVLGAVLIALALCILPAAAILAHLNVAHVFMASLGCMALGTVTFTYEPFQALGSYGGGFTGGSNVAPTAAQAQQVNVMQALAGFTDTDTTWTFTHNWGLSAAQAAALFPEVIMNIVTSGGQASPVAPVIGVNVTSNPNLVTFTKVQATGSGCTMSVVLRRPNSIAG